MRKSLPKLTIGGMASQVQLPPEEDRLERRRRILTETEREVESTRQAFGNAQRAYNLARRKHKKAQREYFALKEAQ